MMGVTRKIAHCWMILLLLNEQNANLIANSPRKGNNMSKQLKIPALPKCIMTPALKKYHHEIKCVLEQFQRDILANILKNAKLNDDAFLEVSTFSDFADASTSVLRMLKDIPGNVISKRLFEIRAKQALSEQPKKGE